MSHRHWIGAALAIVGMVCLAQAKNISIPDFATDPSGPSFSIQPIGPTEGASQNIVSAPNLTFGVTDPLTGTPNTLHMNWEPDASNLPAQAGWKLVFGSDPDLTGHILTLSINPPGAFQQGFGFGGMTHVEVQLADVNNNRVGWGFNTNQAAGAAFYNMPPLALGNDPAAAGKAAVVPAPPFPPPPPPPWPFGITASLAQNFMQIVTIKIGNGPVAGSAVIQGGPAGMLIGPNYLIQNPNFSMANVTQIEFYENGQKAGVAQIPPGWPGLNNYWDHVTLMVPLPGAALAGALLLGGVLVRRRR